MKLRNSTICALTVMLLSFSWAQESQPAGILSGDEVKKVAPSAFFYRGQSASTQFRNSAGIRTGEKKYVLAGLVDTSGYASNVAQKYQGFFITEVKVKIEGSELVPGEYGFGFTADKFVVTDAGANDVLSAAFKNDDGLKRPVPLKIGQDGKAFRLYAGRKYVTIEME